MRLTKKFCLNGYDNIIVEINTDEVGLHKKEGFFDTKEECKAQAIKKREKEIKRLEREIILLNCGIKEIYEKNPEFNVGEEVYVLDFSKNTYSKCKIHGIDVRLEEDYKNNGKLTWFTFYSCRGTLYCTSDVYRTELDAIKALINDEWQRGDIRHLLKRAKELEADFKLNN